MRKRSERQLRESLGNEYPLFIRTIEEVEKELRPALMLLFGSRCRGEHTQLSDIDLLVVSDQLGPDPRESFVRLKRICPAPIEPFGGDMEWLLTGICTLNFLILDALTEGIILYGEGSALNRMQEVLEETVHRFDLKKEPRGWRFDPQKAERAGL